MDSIAFPIKFTSSGLKTLPLGSYEYYKQILTISLLTEQGEHPITPDFGVFDPTFIPIEPEDFILNAARFIPEVEISNINPAIDPDGGLKVEFSFRVRD